MRIAIARLAAVDNRLATSISTGLKRQSARASGGQPENIRRPGTKSHPYSDLAITLREGSYASRISRPQKESKPLPQTPLARSPKFGLC